MVAYEIQIPQEQLVAFSRKWALGELSIFGSAVQGRLGPDSDIDILISFLPGHAMTFEGLLDMRDELSAIFDGREIDLVEKQLLKNPFRRKEILTTRRVVYAA